MFNSTQKALPVASPAENESGNKKPILLSLQRFEKILNNSKQTDRLLAQKEAAEEQKYREYLKKGNDELVAHFKGNLKRTQDKKLDEAKEQLDKKNQQVKESTDQAKENEEQIRREKIAKAEQLLEKLKPGPRVLHSAALQSEVLRARNVQRNINEEFEKAIKKQECLDKQLCEQQAMPWIQEEQQRIADQHQRTNNYKQELLQTINENSKHRSEYKKQLIKEQQAEREVIDQEIKLQIEKERAIMEKKRAALRKNALEAMKMVEQRRLRERMTEEIEDRLCCVYNAGKRQLDTLKLEQMKKMATEREKLVGSNAKQLTALQENIQSVEAERIRRDLSRMQLKFTAEEQEKIRKDKAAKQARIEAYVQELQQQKEIKKRAEEAKRFEIAQRFKNIEVNCSFNEAEKLERQRRIQENRVNLKKQTEEKLQADKIEKEASRICKDDKYDKDDKFFFEYARNLMEDAYKKERPLYPFAKVVQQYKRDNQIDCERKTPKHLLSHINIGCRQADEHKTTSEETKGATSASKVENNAKESILENCLKITKLISAASGDGPDNKKCDAQCPVECMKHDGAGKHSRRLDGLGDCASVTSSAKLRYSMNELKQLNQFSAPTQH